MKILSSQNNYSESPSIEDTDNTKGTFPVLIRMESLIRILM